VRTYSDVLHPNRANVSKDELRSKLSEMYKASKDQVSVFGFRTQFGGGKSTGFALLYDSAEALKKFEPHYRLVRIGQATKIEKASRQQRESTFRGAKVAKDWNTDRWVSSYRQAAQEPLEDPPRYRQDEGCCEEEGEVEGLLLVFVRGWACGGYWDVSTHVVMNAVACHGAQGKKPASQAWVFADPLAFKSMKSSSVQATSVRKTRVIVIGDMLQSGTTRY
jgi:small subunit ribosomal protein S24e